MPITGIKLTAFILTGTGLIIACIKGAGVASSLIWNLTAVFLWLYIILLEWNWD